MPLPELNPDDLPPAWMVILMTLVFPGGGQLALGEKKRGAIFAAITVVLMGLFFLVLAGLVADLLARMQGGASPVIADITGRLAQIGYVLGAGLVEAVIAALDAVALRRRLLDRRR